ncbi:hypothetical protein [Azospirillum sp. SYSU D00513]|uniref:hypothetical protein n=1 Tax=Azospirillum sp. SYSU D00513 TaxID=2812561 RepID=UPI001A97061B|nr:hypothetical protein [Azospirillum sp. SYSU D00513]
MSNKKPRLGHETLILGPMPIRAINAALALELDEGLAVLIPAIRLHVLRRHPEDYERLLPHVASVITAPQFIGDDFKNPGKVELIARVPAAGGPLLVAVDLTMNQHGQYEVRSFYPVAEEKIQGRLSKGYLKRVQIG